MLFINSYEIEFVFVNIVYSLKVKRVKKNFEKLYIFMSLGCYNKVLLIWNS